MTDDSNFAALELRVSTLARKLDENTATTKQIAEDMSSVVDILQAAKGAVKVLNWIASAAKPAGIIAGAIGAIWGMILALKGGK